MTTPRSSSGAPPPEPAEPTGSTVHPPPTSDRSTPELLQTLTQDLRTLVRDEMRNAQEELSDTARRAGRAGALLGGAAALGVLAAGTSAAVVLRAFDRILPPTAAAIATTAVFGAGSVALANAGREELRRAGPLTPQRTLASLREDVEVVASAAGGTR